MLILEKVHLPSGSFGRLRGFHLHHRSLLGIGSTVPFVISEVGILDVKLSKYVWQLPFLEDFSAFSDSLAELEDFEWKDSFELYSEKELALVKEEMEKKIRLQVFHSLHDSNFISEKRSTCQIPN